MATPWTKIGNRAVPTNASPVNPEDYMAQMLQMEATPITRQGAAQEVVQPAPMTPQNTQAEEDPGYQNENDYGNSSNPFSSRISSLLNGESNKKIMDQLQKYLPQQEEGIKYQQDLAKTYAGNPAQLDLSPLAALSDSITPGGKLLAGYKRPESLEDKLKGTSALYGKSQDERQRLIDNLSKMANQKSIDRSLNAQDMLVKRQSFAAHKDVIDKLDKDKDLQQRLGQYKNLDNTLNIVTKAKNVTPEQLYETQQAVRANLGIKGNSGVGEREKDYLDGLGLHGTRWLEFLNTDVRGLPKDHPILEHMKELVGLEQGAIRGQSKQRIDALTSGFEHIYQNNPDLQNSLNKKINAVASQFKPSGIQAASNDPQIEKYSKDNGLSYSDAEKIINSRRK